MTQSDDIKELAAALSKAQGVLSGAAKDTNNPFFKTKYADLASVWDAARKPLADNGLSVCQTTKMEGGEVCLITTLMHSSGQWVAGEMTLAPAKRDPQGYGSAITYMRRYALAAIVGVAPDDDDGNDASRQGQQNNQRTAPVADRTATPPPVTKIDLAPEERQRLEKFTVWFLDQIGKSPSSVMIENSSKKYGADLTKIHNHMPDNWAKIENAKKARLEFFREQEMNAAMFPPDEDESLRAAEMAPFTGGN